MYCDKTTEASILRFSLNNSCVSMGSKNTKLEGDHFVWEGLLTGYKVLFYLNVADISQNLAIIMICRLSSFAVVVCR